MKLMNVMTLPYEPALGGANKANRILSELLAQKGHAVHVIAPLDGIPGPQKIDGVERVLVDRGISVSKHPDYWRFTCNGVEVDAVIDRLRFRQHLQVSIDRLQPDCVIVSSEESTQNLLQTALASGVRTVYLLHTPNFLPCGPNAFYPGKRRAELLSRVHAIVTTSRFSADYVKRWTGLDSFIFYLPVFGTGPFLRLGSFLNGYVTIVNPCRYKGNDIFLEVAKNLHDVRFAAVPGWGTTAADITALGALPNVTFIEPNANIDLVLQSTRVLLVPSLWMEAFGLIIVEAMLRGIPVVASDVGGIPEAKLGTPLVIPVEPIRAFTTELDENNLLIPVVSKQNVIPWQTAVRQLLSDASFYCTHADESRNAALGFVSNLSIDPLEKVLRAA